MDEKGTAPSQAPRRWIHLRTEDPHAPTGGGHRGTCRGTVKKEKPLIGFDTDRRLCLILRLKKKRFDILGEHKILSLSYKWMYQDKILLDI